MSFTLFSIPKPFIGHVGVIQCNAVGTWTRLPGCRVILFGDGAGVAQAATSLGVEHVPHVRCTPRGTPLINDVFAQAQALAGGGICCYSNADILFTADLLNAAQRVAAWRGRFLITGQRTNFDQTEPIDFSPGWEDRLRRALQERGKLFTPNGLDYFVFPHGLWGQLPALVVGRVAWDNWMLFRAVEIGATLIDATPSVLAAHQNHDYSHLAGQQSEAWTGEEAQQNLTIAGHWSRRFTCEHAHWRVTPTGIRRMFHRRMLRTRAEEFLAFRPGLQRFLASARRCVRG